MAIHSVESGQAARLLAEINLDAIASNWTFLDQYSRSATAGAVVKADAYGHGMPRVAQCLYDAGCRLFFTAGIDEAVQLRAVLPDADIAYFDGLGEGDLDLVLSNRIIPSIGDFDQLNRLQSLASMSGATIPAMFNIDTGMNRLGFAPDQIQNLTINDLTKNVKWRLIYSHLACADEANHPMNKQQLDDFNMVIQNPLWADIPKSLAATGGILLGQDYHFDVTRPGIGLYGLTPNGSRIQGVTPALSLKAKVLQINNAPKGQTVGYGASVTLQRPSRLATIAGGYADGINRKLSSQGQIMFNGLKAPMLGRVSMDVHVVDITDWPEDALKTGDWVTLLGHDNNGNTHGHEISASSISAHDWANNCETIAYEMLTTLGLRAKRHYASQCNS